jgi:hypothetical protein
VGRAHEGYRMLRSARDHVSPKRDPLWASRLTRRVAATAYGHGETAGTTDDVRRAVELSSVIRTAASTQKPWPSSPSPWCGRGGRRRAVGSSSTPWPRHTARGRRRPFSGPTANGQCC